MNRIILFLFILCLYNVHGAAQTKIIAHRGFWDTEGSAQNSLTALRNAHEIGVYGSEFDVWLTADGIPVINHDDSIAGFHVETSTYEQLLTVNLENGEKIPALDAYLAEGKKLEGIQLILEIKPHRRIVNEDRLVPKIIDLVKKYDLEDRVDYISFSMNVCKELKRQAPDARIVYLNGNVTPADLKELGLTGLDYSYKVLANNPQWVEEAKQLGLSTNVWTVNIPEMMQAFIDQDIDYMTTDDPLTLKELLAQ